MRKNNKSRRPRAAGQTCDTDIETELSKLSALSLDALRSAWRERLGIDPPAIRSREVFLRMLAWQIQAEVHGALDLKTTRTLAAIAQALARDGAYQPQIMRSLSPGVVVTREWKGIVHKVTVTQHGFQHLGKTYRSLSDIARTITGTRWSGPRFFGLEQRTARLGGKIAS